MRSDLLTLADHMERELTPEQYLQNVTVENGRGCARSWAIHWGLCAEGAGASFYELTGAEWRFLFGLNPPRDCSLAGTIAAIRSIAHA